MSRDMTLYHVTPFVYINERVSTLVVILVCPLNVPDG